MLPYIASQICTTGQLWEFHTYMQRVNAPVRHGFIWFWDFLQPTSIMSIPLIISPYSTILHYFSCPWNFLQRSEETMYRGIVVDLGNLMLWLLTLLYDMEDLLGYCILMKRWSDYPYSHKSLEISVYSRMWLEMGNDGPARTSLTQHHQPPPTSIARIRVCTLSCLEIEMYRLL